MSVALATFGASAAAWTEAAPVEPRRGTGRVYVQPGGLSVAADSTLLSTILGSCVSVCLFDAHARVGGLNHFLLADGSAGPLSTRYGTAAIPELIRRVTALGADPHRLRAKVFGGACISGSAEPRDHLGAHNVALARRLLAERGIPVVAGDVLGRHGRKLVFDTADGTAWIRALRAPGGGS